MAKTLLRGFGRVSRLATGPKGHQKGVQGTLFNAPLQGEKCLAR
jgi:hypothetical protein